MVPPSTDQHSTLRVIRPAALLQPAQVPSHADQAPIFQKYLAHTPSELHSLCSAPAGVPPPPSHPRDNTETMNLFRKPSNAHMERAAAGGASQGLMDRGLMRERDLCAEGCLPGQAAGLC